MPIHVKAHRRGKSLVKGHVRASRRKVGYAIISNAGRERSIERISKTKADANRLMAQYKRGARSSAYIRNGKVVKEQFKIKPYYGK